MRHVLCGEPVVCRRQPLTADPDERLVEMIPYCAWCDLDVPADGLAEDEPTAGQQVIGQ
jgi:hypothetical protein